MLAKYRQIEHLIGRSHHATSEGTFCEVLLKEFLRRTLPKEVSVDSGFIRRVYDTDWTHGSRSPLTADAAIATPQLDIIIHDSHGYAPLMRSEDFVVVLPEAVRGVIEVKKTLNWNSLDESLANLTETTHLLRKWRDEPNRVFTGIFAFDLGSDLDPSSKLISDSFRKLFQKYLDQYDGNCALFGDPNAAKDLLTSAGAILLKARGTAYPLRRLFQAWDRLPLEVGRPPGEWTDRIEDFVQEFADHRRLVGELLIERAEAAVRSHDWATAAHWRDLADSFVTVHDGTQWPDRFAAVNARLDLEKRPQGAAEPKPLSAPVALPKGVVQTADALSLDIRSVTDGLDFVLLTPGEPRRERTLSFEDLGFDGPAALEHPTAYDVADRLSGLVAPFWTTTVARLKTLVADVAPRDLAITGDLNAHAIPWEAVLPGTVRSYRSLSRRPGRRCDTCRRTART